MARYLVTRGRIAVTSGIVIETEDEIFVKRQGTRLQRLDRLPAKKVEDPDLDLDPVKDFKEDPDLDLDPVKDFKEDPDLDLDPVKEEETTLLPESFPALDLLKKNGFDSYQSVSKASEEDLRKINGIGPALFSQIQTALEKWLQE